MSRLLLYKTGVTDPALVPRIGDYEQWFTRVLGPGHELECHQAFERPRHRVGGYDGIIISGSPRSLAEPEPWMDDAAAFVREAADAGVPVLGVCFGHQLLGYAWGGQVRKNPNGWEVGTNVVELTADGAGDPLFRGLPAQVRVNQSHRDEVATLGPGVRRLAGNAHTSTQALAVGEHVRGVQFHPEMDAHVVRGLLDHRRCILAPGGHCVDTLLSRAADTPEAERVLHNFVEHFVAAAAA